MKYDIKRNVYVILCMIISYCPATCKQNSNCTCSELNFLNFLGAINLFLILYYNGLYPWMATVMHLRVYIIRKRRGSSIWNNLHINLCTSIYPQLMWHELSPFFFLFLMICALCLAIHCTEAILCVLYLI